MELFEAIIGRRSIRKFTEQPIEFEKLMIMLDAARYAPSSGNLQNWKFILVTEKDKIRKMFDYCMQQDVFNTAQAAIIVCAEADYAEKFYGLRGKRIYSIQNCASAIQNMLLTAYDLGLGTVWIGGFDEDAVMQNFDIPEDVRPQAIILVGYSAEEPEPKEMKPLQDKVYFNKWGVKVTKPHLIYYNISDEIARRAKEAKERIGEKAKGLKEKLPSKEEIKEKKERLKEKIRIGLERLKEKE